MRAMRTQNTVIMLIGIMLAGALVYAHAQWLNYPDARIPRTKDGKPNLTAPAPRVNGKPDVSGLWQAERTPKSEYDTVLGNGFTDLQPDTHDITKNVINIFWGMKPEEEPLRPEAASILKYRRERPVEFPRTQCLPGSIPLTLLLSLPKDPDPTWMGYSVGRWEGDTLVVDTIGLNDRAWLDSIGHPRSEAMHIIERYHRNDFGHMDLEVTFNDPKYYTRPFTIKTGLRLIPDSDILENVCAENEKDRAHLRK